MGTILKYGKIVVHAPMLGFQVRVVDLTRVASVMGWLWAEGGIGYG